MSKEKEIEEVVSAKKIDLTKLSVNNICKYLGLTPEYISPNFSLYKIGTLISYSKLQKVKKLKFNYNSVLPRTDRIRGSRSTRPSDPGIGRQVFEVRDVEWTEPRAVGTWETTSASSEADPILGNPGFINRFGITTDTIDNRQANLNLEMLRSLPYIVLQRRANRVEHFLAQLPHRLFLDARERNIEETRFLLEQSHIRRLLGESHLENIETERLMPTGEGITDQINHIGYNMSTYGMKEKSIEKKKELTFEERKKEAFNFFKSNYISNPALIKGYYFGNVFISNNEELLEFVNTNSSEVQSNNITIVIKYFYLNEENKVCSNLTTIIFPQKLNIVTKNMYTIIPFLFKLKIKTSNNSDEVFSDSNARKSFVSNLDNKYLDEWFIETSSPRRLSSPTQCVIVTNDKDKKIKFLPADCEFINEELKGYIKPVDKTISSRSIVKLKESTCHKYLIDNCDEEAKVMSIKSNPCSKKISSNCRNHRMDIITIKMIESGKILSVYAQDLKFIKTITKDVKQQQKPISIKNKDFVQAYFESSQSIRNTRSQLDEIWTNTRTTPIR